MPLEVLRSQGVLLSEEEWGEHRLETTVRQMPALLFLLAVASWVMAFLGGPPAHAGSAALVAFALVSSADLVGVLTGRGPYSLFNG